MPRRIAAASVCGLIAGVTITAALTEGLPQHPVGDLLLPVLARLAPLVCVTLVTMKVLRRWLDSQARSTHLVLAAAAEQRHKFRQETDQRLAEIARREDTLTRSAAAVEARTARVHQELLEEREAHQLLQAEHETLMEEYNAVVCATLQQSANRFRSRPPSPNGGHEAAPCIAFPLPLRPRHDGDAVHTPRTAPPALT